MDYLQELLNNANNEFQRQKAAQDEYWQNWLTTQKAKLDAKEEVDPFQKGFYNLMELAISLKQYERPDDENTEITRLIKFSINLSKEEIEKNFKIEVYSLMGFGLYTKMDGLLLTRSTRERMGFDLKGIHRYYDLKSFTEEQKKTYNFSLPIPAMGGLFIPKRTRLLEWVEHYWQLQYFDIVDPK